jgi:hypothetical protein
MTAEEVQNKFDIEKKWIQLIMVANRLASTDNAFYLRRRLNPHHPQEDIDQETETFKVTQHVNFKALKADYILHREDLLKNVGDDQERKSFIHHMENCLSDDFEKVVLT